MGEPKPWVEVLVIQLYDLGFSYGALTGKEHSSLQASMIDNGEDAVISPTLWEICDQVHCYLSEWWGITGHGYFVKGNACPVGEVFVLLADCTTFHILFDPLSHFWPVESL